MEQPVSGPSSSTAMTSPILMSCLATTPLPGRWGRCESSQVTLASVVRPRPGRSLISSRWSREGKAYHTFIKVNCWRQCMTIIITGFLLSMASPIGISGWQEERFFPLSLASSSDGGSGPFADDSSSSFFFIFASRIFLPALKKPSFILFYYFFEAKQPLSSLYFLRPGLPCLLACHHGQRPLRLLPRRGRSFQFPRPHLA